MGHCVSFNLIGNIPLVINLGRKRLIWVKLPPGQVLWWSQIRGLGFGRFRYSTGLPSDTYAGCMAAPLADVAVTQIPGQPNSLSVESQVEDQIPLEIIYVDGEVGDAPKSISQVVQNFRNFICTTFSLTLWKP